MTMSTNRFAVALAVVLFCPTMLLAQQASKPRGAAENAWRYVLYNGRWWYWTADNQWALFDGRRWVTFSPESIGSSLADGHGAGEGVRRGKESPLAGSVEATTRSILDSTRPQSPLGAPSSNVGGSVGRGIGTQPSPITIETVRTRSGDAGSGVGGGSVGGTSITGSTAR